MGGAEETRTIMEINIIKSIGYRAFSAPGNSALQRKYV
jgi:hypothetical protein